jgi:cephalosporin hydroxylase
MEDNLDLAVHGLPVGPNPGPYEAVETFLRENNQFEADRGKESFVITWNPKGYLRRKPSSEHGGGPGTQRGPGSS